MSGVRVCCMLYISLELHHSRLDYNTDNTTEYRGAGCTHDLIT